MLHLITQLGRERVHDAVPDRRRGGPKKVRAHSRYEKFKIFALQKRKCELVALFLLLLRGGAR